MTSPYEENKNKNAADLLRFEAEKQREKELAVDQERQNAGVPASFSTELGLRASTYGDPAVRALCRANV